MKKLIVLVFINLALLTSLRAQEYNSSLFGCKSDGVTDNTSSIQYAIDFISAKGGGKLNFYVGRYLTGGLQLKSNVTIELHEGAILLASPNFYDYIKNGSGHTLISAEKVDNVSISGKGVIEGQVDPFFAHLNGLISKGYLPGNAAAYTPSLLSFIDCNDVKISGIMFKNSPSIVQQYVGVNSLELSNQIINSTIAKDSKGIVLKNSKAVTLKNLYLETSGQSIAADKSNQLLLVENSTLPNGKSIL